MTGPSAIQIAVVLPDILGTYGDTGNALVLRQRARWRGMAAECVTVTLGMPVPASCDVYVLGGGEDNAQALAAAYLRQHPGLREAADGGAVVFAVCAGLQILGHRFTAADGHEHAGLGLLDVETTPMRRRAVGEVLAWPAARADEPLTGFENHGGATTLGASTLPLGRVVRGVGNGAGDDTEGAVQGRIVGTYLHGPALARNPLLADLLLGWVTGVNLPPLPVPDVDTLRQARLHTQGHFSRHRL